MGKYDRLIEALEALPERRREEIVAVLFDLIEGQADEYQLTPEQEAEIERRLSQPPDIASEAEVEAFFAKFAR